MAQIVVLSSASDAAAALPALPLLNHRTRQIPAQMTQLLNAPDADLIFVDARADLLAAKNLSRVIHSAEQGTPLLLIVTEGGLAAVTPEWGIDDVVLTTAGPAEIDARIRLALGRSSKREAPHPVQSSGVVIDESAYSAKVDGRLLDLTYKEFQLLHFLVSNPSRVFTREQLLSEVWGYDYYGGTRTVDVHVRRLRAKLGDLEQIIGTVRNVGYRFNGEDEAPDAAN